MRRARDGYVPLATQPPADDLLEHENEQMAQELSSKITSLKSLSIDIGNEVRYQRNMLNALDDDVDRSGGFLSKTMGRVLRLGKGNHNYYIFYLFVFAIFVFFLLYVVLKLR